jgi:hypothetical protein
VPLFRPPFFKQLLLLLEKKLVLLRPFALLLLQGPPALSLGLELFELPHAFQFPL